MDAIGHWLTSQLGLSNWVVGLFVLPLLAVLLIFGLRELLLAVVSHVAGDWMHRAGWRRATKSLAILLSLVAVAFVLKAHASEITSVLSSAKQGRAEEIFISLVSLLGYTAVLAVLLLAVKRGFNALDERLQAWSGSSGGLRFQNVVLLDSEHGASLARLAIRILRFGLVLFLFYLYIPVTLSSIPQTRPLAHRVMPYVLEPLSTLGRGIVDFIPNLITMILIVVVVKWSLRMFKIFMDAVGSGDITIGSFNPAWARQTYRLLHLLVLVFTIVLVYPLLPGSGSPIFKGVSVFLGALVTFGARNSVANLVAGLLLTYNRTFEVGDRVQVGTAVGDVT